MSAPALQQKKSERNAKLAKEAAAAATKAKADGISFEQAITDRAKAYEAEYNKVSISGVVVKLDADACINAKYLIWYEIDETKDNICKHSSEILKSILEDVVFKIAVCFI